MSQWALFEHPSVPIVVVVRRRRRLRKAARQIPFYLWMPERDALEYLAGVPYDSLSARVVSEAALALAIQRGGAEGAEAFDTLMVRIAYKIERAALRHACEWWPAEEVAVDLMAQLWRVCRHYQYRRGASLLSLIDRAIVNYAASEARRRKVRRADEIDQMSNLARDTILDSGIQDHGEVELRADLVDLSEDAQAMASWFLDNGELPHRRDLGWPPERFSLAKSEIAAWLSQRNPACDKHFRPEQVQLRLI